jgi:hypothetical protein
MDAFKKNPLVCAVHRTTLVLVTALRQNISCPAMLLVHISNST